MLLLKRKWISRETFNNPDERYNAKKYNLSFFYILWGGVMVAYRPHKPMVQFDSGDRNKTKN